MYVNKINFNPSLESYLFGSIRNKVSVNSKEEHGEYQIACKAHIRRNFTKVGEKLENTQV